MNLTVDVIIEGLSYIELMLIWNSEVDCAGFCVRIILLIAYLSESLFGLFELVRVSLLRKQS